MKKIKATISKNDPRTLTIGPCRLSYASLLEVKKFDPNEEGKYMTNVLIPKSEKDVLATVKKAIDAAKAEGLARMWNGKLPGGYKEPLYDGAAKNDENYEGMMYLNPKSSKRPAVVDKDLSVLTSEDDVYSGMWANVCINFFPYNSGGGKGVGAALRSVMKVADGERLGNAANPEKDFEGFIDSNDDDDDEL